MLLVCELMLHAATLGVSLLHLNKQHTHMDVLRRLHMKKGVWQRVFGCVKVCVWGLGGQRKMGCNNYQHFMAHAVTLGAPHPNSTFLYMHTMLLSRAICKKGTLHGVLRVVKVGRLTVGIERNMVCNNYSQQMAHPASLGAPHPHICVLAMHIKSIPALFVKKDTAHGVLRVLKVWRLGLGDERNPCWIVLYHLMAHPATLGVPHLFSAMIHTHIGAGSQLLGEKGTRHGVLQVVKVWRQDTRD